MKSAAPSTAARVLVTAAQLGLVTRVLPTDR